MKIIEVKAKKPYKICFGEGILGETPDILRNTIKGNPMIFVVTDKNVARHYLKPFIETIKSSGYRVGFAIFKPGEELKTFKNIQKLLHKMVLEDLSRDSIVVGFGGGVVGDFSGFAASIYMRGIGLIQVPTTLLAQVDSSIGGKVGINLPEGKNLIGSFKSPIFVLIDPSTLLTLEAREIVAGIGEIIKAGLILDDHLFERIESFFGKNFGYQSTVSEEMIKKNLLKERDFLSELILKSIKVKQYIVERDEEEHGLRMILNFGHTFAHAIEKLLGYRSLLHGEAVILGIRIAVELSAALGILPEPRRDRIEKLLRMLPVPKFRQISAKSIYNQIGRDKKKRGGQLHYVLLKNIGEAATETEVDKETIINTISHIIPQE